MARAATHQPVKSVPIGVVVFFTTLAVVGLTWWGIVPFAAVWLGTIIVSFTRVPPVLTGTRDKLTGRQEPADDQERKAERTYRVFLRARGALFFPTGSWFPGKQVQLGWLWTLAAAAVAWCVPTPVPFNRDWGQWVDALLMFSVVAALTGAARQVPTGTIAYSGTTVASGVEDAKKHPLPWVFAGAGGLVVGVVVATLLSRALSPYGVNAPVMSAVTALVFVLAFLTPRWIKASQAEWRTNESADQVWRTRWKDANIVPEPHVVSVEHVGPAVVVTFEAPGSVGSVQARKALSKLAPMIGAGVQVAALTNPNIRADGQEEIGTVHPTRFRIVTWPSGGVTNLSDVKVGEQEARLAIECALAWTADDYRWDSPPLIVNLERIYPPGQAPEAVSRPVLKDRGDYIDYTSDEHRYPGTASTTDNQDQEPAGELEAVWQLEWATNGVSPLDIRTMAMPRMAYFVSSTSATAHRDGLTWVGNVDEAPRDQVWEAHDGSNPRPRVSSLADEDQWLMWWAKTDTWKNNPPTYQAAIRKHAEVGGYDLTQVAFVGRDTQKPEEFLGNEKLLATVMEGMTFINMTGFQVGGGRPGERHPKGIVVTYGQGRYPAEPSALAPEPGAGPHWVLAKMVNQMFAGARLAAPELVSAEPLSSDTSPAHMWMLNIRLYGGVTLAEVRGAREKMRQALGVPWLRVVEAEDGVAFALGAPPAEVTFADIESEQTAIALDFEQAMIDAHVTGAGGRVPKLLGMKPLEKNKLVKQLVFALPAGVDVAKVSANRNKLAANTSNSFVDVRSIPGKANQVLLLISERDPIPTSEKVHYDELDTGQRHLPFGTGIDGASVNFNLAVDAHLLVVGGTGSGKTTAVQNMVTGALLNDMHFFAADPSKGLVDMRYAVPYAHGFEVQSVERVAAMLHGIYETYVEPRKELLKDQGAVKIEELTPTPPRVLLLLDEFTSMTLLDDEGSDSKTIEVDDTRAQIIAENRAKRKIGKYLGKIVREARYVGITILLATQKLAADDLSKLPGGNTFKTNMSRLGMGQMGPGERASAFRVVQNIPSLGEAPPQGRGIFEPMTGAPVVVQTWWEPGGQAELSAQVAAVRTPVTDALDYTPWLDDDTETDVDSEVLEMAFDPGDNTDVPEQYDTGIDWDALVVGGSSTSAVTVHDATVPAGAAPDEIVQHQDDDFQFSVAPGADEGNELSANPLTAHDPGDSAIQSEEPMDEFGFPNGKDAHLTEEVTEANISTEEQASSEVTSVEGAITEDGDGLGPDRGRRRRGRERGPRRGRSRANHNDDLDLESV